MVGDTPWDVEAAKKAGVETVAVRTGGAYSEGELLEKGAVRVYETVEEELRHDLDYTPLS